MQKTCIIIPCYNEENRLPIGEIEDFLKDNSFHFIDLCFVNDGSKDSTIKILNELKSKFNDRIFVIDLKNNVGKAHAVREGMLYTSNSEVYELIGFFDADLATPIEEVKNMTDEINNNSNIVLIFGSRIRRIGANIARSSKRHYFGRIFSTFASLILHLPIYDTQCGAKIFKSDIINIIFKEPFISKWLFDIEIFARLRNYYGREKVKTIMYELPLNTWIEKGGSKLKFSYMLKVPFELLKIKRKYKIKNI